MDPQKLLADLGALGIIVTTFLDGLNAPIPSEVLLPLIGALAAEGSFHPLAAIGLAWVGTLGGACAAYGLGRFAAWPLKRWFRYDPAAHAGWRRWGDATLVVGRWLPGLRTLISFPAGASRINFWRYTALSALGFLPWIIALVAAGYYAEEAITRYSEALGRYLVWACIALVALQAGWKAVRAAK